MITQLIIVFSAVAMIILLAFAMNRSIKKFDKKPKPKKKKGRSKYMPQVKKPGK